MRLAAAFRIHGDDAAIGKLVERRRASAAAVGDLYAADGEWERAIELYGKAVDGEDVAADPLARRARAYLATGQWELARTDWLNATRRQPDLVQSACDSFRTAGRWAEAAEFALKLIDETPADPMAWLRAAPLVVLAGDESAYKDFCARVASQFAETTDVRDSRLACKACLLSPQAIDPDRLPRQAFVSSFDDATTPAAGLAWSWSVRALLAYRSGDAKSAMEYVQQSEENRPAEFARAVNLSVRALAQNELGDPTAALEALDAASQLVDRLREVKNNRGHHDLLMAEILLREAEAKINGPSKPAGEAAPVPPAGDGAQPEK